MSVNTESPYAVRVRVRIGATSAMESGMRGGGEGSKAGRFWFEAIGSIFSLIGTGNRRKNKALMNSKKWLRRENG